MGGGAINVRSTRDSRLPLTTAICIALWTSACLGPGETLLVIVEDPDGLATSAESLAISDDVGTPTLFAIDGGGFPTRVLLTAEQRSVQSRLTIDAVASVSAGGATLARAVVWATFDSEGTRSLVAQLAAVCGLDAALGEACSLPDGSGVGGICTRQGCGSSACGDGFVDIAAGEQCDDGNLHDGDACESNCMANVCGDGSWYPLLEACDDGNTQDGDGCRADCSKLEVCSDRVTDVGEACDDGNDNPNDGCDACSATEWLPSVVLGMHDDGALIGLDLKGPGGLALDPFGNLLIADTGGNRLWRLDALTERATRLAGSGGPGVVSPSPLAAGTPMPHGIATDSLGNIYFTLTTYPVVLKIDLQGELSIVAGTGSPGFNWNESLSPLDSRLSTPSGLAWLPAWGLLIVDTGNHRVRLLDREGRLTTVAGSGPVELDAGVFAGDGGAAIEARLNLPSAVAALPHVSPRAFVVADTGNNRLRVVFLGGTITTLVGTGEARSSGDYGPGSLAATNGPTSVAVDANGDLLFAEGGQWGAVSPQQGVLIPAPGAHAIRRYRRDDSSVEPLLRVEQAGATLNLPVGVVSDSSGRVWVSDRNNQRIIQMSADGQWSTYAGRNIDVGGQETFPALSATWFLPTDLAYAQDGTAFVTDWGGHRIDAVGTDGVVRVIAGGGPVGVLLGGYSGDGGPAVDARLQHPRGIAVAPQGSGDLLYFCDSINHAIRAIAADGTIRTIAGDGTSGSHTFGSGLARDARLHEPTDVAVDLNGNIIVADTLNHVIREIDMTANPPTIRRVAGTGAYGMASDGLALDEPMRQPNSVIVDASNTIIVGDIKAHKIWKIHREGLPSTWTISTVAGSGVEGYSPDGAVAATAALVGPLAVALGSAGEITFIDFIDEPDLGTTGRIRTVEAGLLRTWAGASSQDYRGDWGPAPAAAFVEPRNIAARPGGGLGIIDRDSLREIDGNNIVSTSAGSIYPGDGGHTRGNLGSPWSMVELLPGAWVVADGFGLRVRLLDVDGRHVSTVVGYPGGEAIDSDDPVPAQRARQLNQVTGVAYAKRRGALFITERSAHVVHKIRIPDPGTPSTWTIQQFVGKYETAGLASAEIQNSRLDLPTAVALNADESILYIADAGTHTLRAVDLETEQVTLLAGEPYSPGFRGDGDVAMNTRLYTPTAMAFAPDGSLFVADAGNHRIRRFAADADGSISPQSLVSTIVGDGVASSSGTGVPASAFSVDTPLGILFDAHGNLFVSSRTSIKVIDTGEDGAVGPEDAIHTIYGAAPRSQFPESITHCLSGLGMSTADHEIFVLDRCQGWLLKLSRQQRPL